MTAPMNAKERARRISAHSPKVGMAASEEQKRPRDVDSALLDHERALSIARSIAILKPGDESRREVVVALHVLGTTLIKAQHFALAHATYKEALSIIEPLALAQPGNNRYRRDLWYVKRNLGTIFSILGNDAEGMGQLSKALALKQELIAADPTDGGTAEDCRSLSSRSATLTGDRGESALRLKLTRVHSQLPSHSCSTTFRTRRHTTI